ncbi:UNVERIFIED_CONTAM: Mitogen-activated protein kinase kinase kinase 20 [Sesamum indicum]
MNGRVKIADFRLTKRDGGRKGAATGCKLRGTPLYMSSEMVAGASRGLRRIFGRLGEEVPEIPRSLSEEMRDFLGKCFVKDPSKRWTAEML